MKERKWDITLLSEIRSEAPGTLWLGDGRDRMALVHSRKTGVVLSGSALEEWTRNGQKVEHGERTTAVVTEGARFVAAYQPLWSRGEEEVEAFREEVENQMARSWRGGDPSSGRRF